MEGLFTEATLSLTDDGLALVEGLKADGNVFFEVDKITDSYPDKFSIKKLRN